MDMDAVQIIQIVAGMLAVSVLVLYIIYIISLSRALSKCSVASRTMQPGMVWLLLVPLFSLVWQFFVVIGLADSLGKEFRARGIPNVEPEPGKSIGIAMCVCGVCVIIPILGVIAAIAHIILWIIYWVKITEFSRRLDQIPATSATPNSMPGI
jgi:hypothetical protein